MYQLINDILLKFLPEFKRTKTWRWFVVMVMGLMIRKNHNGVTSTIAALRIKPELYHTALHFYRSEGYDVNELYGKWIHIATEKSNLVVIGGRMLILADHIKISKEGRRMPDIQIHHQESQNSGKSEYVEGHIYGNVSAVITAGNTSRSLPLLTHLHKVPPKDEATKKPIGDTIVVQMINSVGEDAKQIGKPVLSVKDAYFCKASTFNCAETITDDNGEKLVEVVVRAASDTIAFTAPIAEKTPGRPRKYGDKIALYSLFSDMSGFTETTLTLYGKPTKVRFNVMDLTWKPIGKLIRFVAVESSMGKMVLMSSSLTLTAEEIITAYALRYKIEPGFNELKNTMGGFSYRFWTTALPKRKKWKKNSQPAGADLTDKRIIRTKSATETFVCLSTIATGILTIVAFSHNDEIWNRYQGWIRTRRSDIPTVSIAKEVIAHDFNDVLSHSSCFMGFNFIRSLRRVSNFFFASQNDSAV